ncbi:MAG: four helix bundle protein [Myxococcota bacterium]
MYFEHEKLDVYPLAVKVARWAAGVGARRSLKDQVVRAAESVVLNIAEGAALPPGDAKRNHFRIALGSAAEVAAAIDLLGDAARADDIRRVGAMLAGLSRR